MIYLDNAATTLPKPRAVVEAVTHALETMGNPGRGAHPAALDAARAVYAAREEIAALFHAPAPERVAFAANATQALNTVLQGLVGPGDRVVTTVQEHNSVLRPLYRIGARLEIVPLGEDGRVHAQAVAGAIDSGVRAVVVTHASNVTGDALELSVVGRACRAHGVLLIVDAAQTAGALSIDMERDFIDALCFTGHKGLYGPQGTGGICLGEGVFVPPLCVGGSGVRTFDSRHPDAMPEALEAGTINAQGIAGLLAGVRFVRAQGVEAIGRREAALSRALGEAVADAPGVRLYGDWRGENRTGVLAMRMEGIPSAEVADALAQRFGVFTRAGGHCAPLMHTALGTRKDGLVRLSFSALNTMEDVRAAAAAIRTLAEE